MGSLQKRFPSLPHIALNHDPAGGECGRSGHRHGRQGVDARFPVDELGKERIDGGFEVRIVREGVKPLPEHDFPGAFPDGERAAVRLGPEERGSEQDAEIVGIGQAAPVPCDPVRMTALRPARWSRRAPRRNAGAAAFVESQFESAGFSEIFNK